MHVIELELIDLGDATAETKQISPAMIYPDALFGWGQFY